MNKSSILIMPHSKGGTWHVFKASKPHESVYYHDSSASYTFTKMRRKKVLEQQLLAAAKLLPAKGRQLKRKWIGQMTSSPNVVCIFRGPHSFLVQFGFCICTLFLRYSPSSCKFVCQLLLRPSFQSLCLHLEVGAQIVRKLKF